MANEDEVLRAYSILASLRKNVPQGRNVQAKWANEFNAALAKLEKSLAISLEEFKVPEAEFHQLVGSRNYLTGEVGHMPGLWCDRDFLMQRLDSVLNYFTGLQGEGEKRIGFRKP
jgi:hypothetical protein